MHAGDMTAQELAARIVIMTSRVPRSGLAGSSNNAEKFKVAAAKAYKAATERVLNKAKLAKAMSDLAPWYGGEA